MADKTSQRGAKETERAIECVSARERGRHAKLCSTPAEIVKSLESKNNLHRKILICFTGEWRDRKTQRKKERERENEREDGAKASADNGNISNK